MPATVSDAGADAEIEPGGGGVGPRCRLRDRQIGAGPLGVVDGAERGDGAQAEIGLGGRCVGSAGAAVDHREVGAAPVVIVHRAAAAGDAEIVRAVAALFAPVPPLTTASGVPDQFGVVNAVGNRERAQAEVGAGGGASLAPVPPLARARSVPHQLALLMVEAVARLPRPRLVRAVPASLAPVPPLTTARSVPSQSSLLMVPPPPPPPVGIGHGYRTAGVAGNREHLRAAGAVDGDQIADAQAVRSAVEVAGRGLHRRVVCAWNSSTRKNCRAGGGPGEAGQRKSHGVSSRSLPR